jgi:hypothetical protein
MTYDEAIYKIWEKLRPNLSDDDDIDYRLISQELHTQRALWLRNELNKNRSIDQFLVQSLGCVEMQPVDRAECCDITIDCSILRSVQKIPSTIELHHTNTLWINPVDSLEKSFSMLDYERAKWIKGNRFTSRQIHSFILNNYVYLVSEDDSHSQITHISVKGIFENPEEVASFNTCDGESCFSGSSVYPIKQWMFAYVEAQAVQNLMTKLKHPVDTTNNAKSDPKPIA